MAWLQIDDNVPLHRKMLAAGPAACWLWVCGIAYSQRQLTDGFIPDLALPMVGVTGASRAKKLADALVSVGLFEVVDGGYRVHDYHDHNATAIEARQHKAVLSERRAEAGRRGGIRSGIERRKGIEATKQNGSKASEANEAPPQPFPLEPPTPLQGAVEASRSSVPPMPDAFIADAALAERAGQFLERWETVYAQARSGARYTFQQRRDWDKALGLVHAWPDVNRLSLMGDVFLRRSDIGPKNIPGTLGQFAHMAPDCDRLLRENGR